MERNYEQLEQRLNNLHKAFIKLEIIVLGLAKIQKDVVIKQEKINKNMLDTLILIKNKLNRGG